MGGGFGVGEGDGWVGDGVRGGCGLEDGGAVSTGSGGCHDRMMPLGGGTWWWPAARRGGSADDAEGLGGGADNRQGLVATKSRGRNGEG